MTDDRRSFTLSRNGRQKESRRAFASYVITTYLTLNNFRWSRWTRYSSLQNCSCEIGMICCSASPGCRGHAPTAVPGTEASSMKTNRRSWRHDPIKVTAFLPCPELACSWKRQVRQLTGIAASRLQTECRLSSTGVEGEQRLISLNVGRRVDQVALGAAQRWR